MALNRVVLLLYTAIYFFKILKQNKAHAGINTCLFSYVLTSSKQKQTKTSPCDVVSFLQGSIDSLVFKLKINPRQKTG